MNTVTALRGILGALAGGFVVWLAERTGVHLETEWLVALGIGVYVAAKQWLARWTKDREPSPALATELGALREQLDILGGQVLLIEGRLPPRCDYRRGLDPCTHQRGHDGSHSFEDEAAT